MEDTESLKKRIDELEKQLHEERTKRMELEQQVKRLQSSNVSLVRKKFVILYLHGCSNYKLNKKKIILQILLIKDLVNLKLKKKNWPFKSNLKRNY